MGRNSGGVRNTRHRKINGKTRSKVMRDFYTRQMSPLLTKHVSVNGNGHIMSVGFTKEGNKHLFNDAMSKAKGIQMGDLTRMDAILSRAKFVKKSKNYKERNDNIARFYYYKVRLHGSTIYLNVAEKEKRVNGTIKRNRYLYAVTKNLK